MSSPITSHRCSFQLEDPRVTVVPDSRSTSKFAILLVAVLLCIIALAGGFLWIYQHGHKESVLPNDHSPNHSRHGIWPMPALSPLPLENGTCLRHFYTWNFSDFELLRPDMRSCHLTVYAAVAEAAAWKAHCRTDRLEDADVFMIPPYLANDCNWPVYGGGNCFNGNQYRAGTVCRKEVTAAVRELQDEGLFRGKPILLLDQSTSWTPYDLPREEYATPGWIFAKGNAKTTIYRLGIDVSMPPSAFKRCLETPDEAYDEPLSAKRYFLSFKSSLSQEGPRKIRHRAQSLFHNGRDVIIVERSDDEYDFDYLMQHSRFNLILRGDIEFSYRFNEAVCSGGVPVLVTDVWVPPFNESVAFESYGVYVRESELDKLLEILRSFSDEEVQRRRLMARKACAELFQSVEISVLALLRLQTQKIMPGSQLYTLMSATIASSTQPSGFESHPVLY